MIPQKNALLAALGGRTTDVLCTIDFECFYSKDFSLTKYTTEAYVRDPQFEVIGVGVKFGPHPTVWLEEWEFAEWVKQIDWRRVAVCAHHAQLDAFILSQRYGVIPGFLLCTMSMARALHSEASLEYLGPLYGAGQKGDELEKTKGKRRRDFTQEEWVRFGTYCIQDVDITDRLLRPMSNKLPAQELWLIDTTIRAFTEPSFRADRDVLVRARDAERKKKSELLRAVAMSAGVSKDLQPAETEEAARAILASNDKFAALLKSLGEEPPTKISKTTDKETWAFAKNDPGMQSLLEHERDDIRALAETRLAVKSTITETRAERIIQISERGLVPFYLKYCGAHTHRFSGGDKMNPQNFNRGGDLRDAILSEEGWVLVVADSGQIEARVLPWLARDSRLLETFRRNDQKTADFEHRVATLQASGIGAKEAKQIARAAGLEEGDFYSDEGSALFLMKVSKEETPAERQLSKNMLLGLGFGMGLFKFGGEQLKGMLGSKPVQFTQREVEKYLVNVAGFERRSFGRSGKTCGQIVEEMRKGGIRLNAADALVHFAVADHLVRLYRDKNRPIVELWRSMESVLKAMVEGEDDPERVQMRFGPLTVRHQSIEKPSGMRLRYPGLRQQRDGFTYLGGKSGRERSKVYGALIAENVVQSIARDIVMEQSLWIRAKYATPDKLSPIGTTTHDEVVSVVPAARGAECLAYSLERMRIPPPWCTDLPLSASGGFGTSYGAVK